jgi:type I restriction enzyme M protein
VAKSNTGANPGFEEKLWAAADKLRGHMDAAEYKSEYKSEYKHVVLGLIFLKYISDAFQEKYRWSGRQHSCRRSLRSRTGLKR